jgi:hypothetical protein
MFEEFSDGTRKVLALVNQMARELNHEFLGPERALLGVC